MTYSIQSSEKRQFTGWKKGRILISRIFAAFAVIFILVSTHPTEIHGFKDAFLAAIGLVMVLVSIRGRVWCILYIGGRKDRALVTDGPYARCRNPLYYYSLLGITGVGAASGMLSLIVILPILFLIGYYFVIRSEERKLFQIHGDQFLAYCQKVPRFWPALTGLNEVEKHEFSPKLFHRTFWEASTFLLGWLFVVVIHIMHGLDMLPQWLRWH